MSRIDELIRKNCPDGVIFLTLGETCDIKTGAGITKKDATEDGIYPIISGGIEPLGMYHKTNRKANTVTIARAGGAGYVNYIEEDFYLNDKCFSIIPSGDYASIIDSRFLYFVLKNDEENIISMKSTGSVPTVNTQKIAKIKIPVPPLEVQQEIVRMLNSFTELEAELKAELTKRKQQFTFFRDLLFSSENLEKEGGKIRRCTLGEIAEFERGGSFQKKDFIEEGEVPCIHYGQIYTRFNNTSVKEPLTYISTEVAKKQKFAHTNDLVMAITSENMEDVCKTIVWNGEQDIAVSGHTTIIRHNENPKFLAYFFQTADFFSQKRRVARGTKVIEISPESLKKIVINLPERKVQDKIAETIESFELLMTDMSSGLPAEIEVRHKQYEYYRNKLLSFS